MNSPKEIAQQLLAKLPDDVTWGQIAYTFYVRMSVEQGMKDIEEGRGIPHEDVMKEMDEWLASFGHPNRKKTSKSTLRELQKIH